jgi:hypothetical protein
MAHRKEAPSVVDKTKSIIIAIKDKSIFKKPYFEIKHFA